MQVLLTIGLLLFVVNVTYWLVMFQVVRGIPTNGGCSINERTTALIIVAHNDLIELKSNLTSWLSQADIKYSVVIVDDGSTDGTTQWMEKQDKLHGHLEFFSFKKDNPGKKTTLAKILGQRLEDYVVLTDADCQPADRQWLAKTIHCMETGGAGIFLGYGPLIKTNSWVNKLSRFETMMTALNYLTWSQLGKTYMGVGRNLAYRRDVYKNYRVIHPELASGDDDLFVQSASESTTIVASLDPQTFVYSKSPENVTTWLNQKSRHVTTSYAYQWPVKIGLAVFGATQVLWPFLIIWNLKIFIGVLLCRWLIFVVFSSKVAQTLDSKDLLKYWPLLEISLIISYILILPWSWFKKQDQW